jgi:hypothetical protein
VVILGKRLANYQGLISGIPVHLARPDSTEGSSQDTGIGHETQRSSCRAALKSGP